MRGQCVLTMGRLSLALAPATALVAAASPAAAPVGIAAAMILGRRVAH